MSIHELARPEIQALEPYEAAQQVVDTIRLNANEAPWTSSADRFARPLNRYPEIRPARLQALLAGHYGCDARQLLVTRGTSEAIDLLIRSFCRSGQDNIVTTAPTFSMYRHYAEIQGAEVRAVETLRDADFAVDPDNILAACDDHSRLVFLCSPNNPTATSIPESTLRAVLEDRAARSAVVIDEAYIEFSSATSAIKLLDEYDNLIVLRTLSKALAFAGARCGSVIGPEAVVRMLSAVQAPYALATPVVECVEAALSSSGLAEAQSFVEELIEQRQLLMAAVETLPWVRRTWPSDANFFLVAVVDAEAVMRQTRADRVLLRYFGGELSDCLRISVGSPAENAALLESLRKIKGVGA